MSDQGYLEAWDKLQRALLVMKFDTMRGLHNADARMNALYLLREIKASADTLATWLENYQAQPPQTEYTERDGRL